MTAFVLGVGLLGLAGLQLSSLRNTQSADQRSEITKLIYEMADAMRSNPLGVLDKAYHLGAATSDDCLAAACTAAQLAGHDLARWNAAVAQLPGGRGIVCIDNTPNDGGSADSPDCDGVGNVYAIKIWWDDKRTGNLAEFERMVTSFAP